jgi:hypothetical protein
MSDISSMSVTKTNPNPRYFEKNVSVGNIHIRVTVDKSHCIDVFTKSVKHPYNISRIGVVDFSSPSHEDLTVSFPIQDFFETSMRILKWLEEVNPDNPKYLQVMKVTGKALNFPG